MPRRTLFDRVAYHTMVFDVAHRGYTRLDLHTAVAVSGVFSLSQGRMRDPTQVDAVLRNVRTKYQGHERPKMLILYRFFVFVSY